MGTVTEDIEARAIEYAERLQDAIQDAPRWSNGAGSGGANGVVPFTDGNLEDSQFVGPLRVSDESVSFDTGFIAVHAPILEDLRVIRPTRAGVKALRWIGPDGSPIFRAKVDNRYHRWFSEKWLPWARELVSEIGR